MNPLVKEESCSSLNFTEKVAKCCSASRFLYQRALRGKGIIDRSLLTRLQHEDLLSRPRPTPKCQPPLPKPKVRQCKIPKICPPRIDQLAVPTLKLIEGVLLDFNDVLEAERIVRLVHLAHSNRNEQPHYTMQKCRKKKKKKHRSRKENCLKVWIKRRVKKSCNLFMTWLLQQVEYMPNYRQLLASIGVYRLLKLKRKKRRCLCRYTKQYLMKICEQMAIFCDMEFTPYKPPPHMEPLLPSEVGSVESKRHIFWQFRESEGEEESAEEEKEGGAGEGGAGEGEGEEGEEEGELGVDGGGDHILTEIEEELGEEDLEPIGPIDVGEEDLGDEDIDGAGGTDVVQPGEIDEEISDEEGEEGPKPEGGSSEGPEGGEGEGEGEVDELIPGAGGTEEGGHSSEGGSEGEVGTDLEGGEGGEGGSIGGDEGEGFTEGSIGLGGEEGEGLDFESEMLIEGEGEEEIGEGTEVEGPISGEEEGESEGEEEGAEVEKEVEEPPGGVDETGLVDVHPPDTVSYLTVQVYASWMDEFGSNMITYSKCLRKFREALEARTLRNPEAITQIFNNWATYLRDSGNFEKGMIEYLKGKQVTRCPKCGDYTLYNIPADHEIPPQLREAVESTVKWKRLLDEAERLCESYGVAATTEETVSLLSHESIQVLDAVPRPSETSMYVIEDFVRNDNANETEDKATTSKSDAHKKKGKKHHDKKKKKKKK